MLNSVTESARRRLSADDRRRQLLSIGLAKLVETPIQDLSLDEIAVEAGISRGLLFHYFPTKTDFYLACIAAAGRRIARNTRPDESEPGEQQVEFMVRAMIEQITRRRAFYLSLVHGVSDPRVIDVYENVRTVGTDRVMAALEIPGDKRAVVHAWWAYVEDRAFAYSAEPIGRTRPDLDSLVRHCCAALPTLLALG